MIFSVVIEMLGSVSLTHPGAHGLAHEQKLLFSPSAADTHRQMQTVLEAFAKAELAFQL